MDTMISMTTHARPPLIINAGLYARLLALAEQARKHAPKLADHLLEEIERAELCPPESMPDDVVTIGSTVTYREGARTQTVQIVMPGDADVAHGRVSVIAPVGTALLGLSVGQEIVWEMPGGRARRLEVLDVRRTE
jgi:regulator of nucleoside diphosphate kinase